jgi:N-acetylglutamate synthase-like GNAT family acetyltransferase
MKILETKNDVITIVEARKKHILTISELTRGENLRYRPPEEIDSQRSNFLVALNQKGKVMACVGSKFYDFDAEIIALKVIPEYQRQGLAKMLLKQKIRDLRSWPRLRIFALTTENLAANLFFPLGFIKVGIQLFSSKVLMDCAECPKNRMEGGIHLCNEIAVLYQG